MGAGSFLAGLGAFSKTRRQQKEQEAAEQQRLEDRVFQQKHRDLQMRSLEDALNRPKPEPAWDVQETDQGLVQINPRTGEVRPLKLEDAILRPPQRQYKAEAPEPVVQVEGPDGKPVYVRRSEAAGKRAPAPRPAAAPREPTQPATIQSKIAANRAQLTVIEDALRELTDNEQAVGPKRGIGEVIPLLGGVQDMVNQHVDPKGVGARAQIANIGSLKMHDRSGAAVSLSEFPRLKPFIPSVGDTPQAIRTKLAKLRAAVEEETRLLEGGGASVAPSPDEFFTDDEVLAAYNAGKRTDADIAAHIRKMRGGQ